MKYYLFIIGFVTFTLTPSCTKQSEECQTKCSQKGETGPCKALSKKYYFDTTEKKCKEFIWGGCNGVVPFQTLEECQSCGCK